MKNTKTCYKCSIEQSLSEFHKNCRKSDGYEYICNSCKKEISKKYYLNHKAQINKQHKNYRDTHKEEIYVRNRKWIKENEKLVKKLKTNFYICHPHYDRDYIRNKLKTDIQFRIKKNIARRFSLALKENWKSGRTIELLGCSIEFFKQYLESQFKEGMSWENYGKGGWVIDHIKPCVSFDLRKVSEQKKCEHYTNKQPMWEIDNLTKHAKIL